MPRVYVSVGSNIARDDNIRGAVRALRRRFGNLQVSSVYQTPAEGFVGDDFYNLAAGFVTELSIENVLSVLTEIEAAHGRTRAAEKYGPRTLDIDLLLYGDLVRHEAGTNVPRPELLRFGFMLGPLAEIAATLRHPETHETLDRLWRKHRDYGMLRRITLDLTTAQ